MRRYWLGVFLLLTFFGSGVLEMANQHLWAQVTAGWFVTFLVYALIRAVIRAGAPKIRQ